MLDIWDGSYNFQDTAKYHGYTPEELGVAFAVFGVQAMEIMQQRSVVSVLSSSPDDHHLMM